MFSMNFYNCVFYLFIVVFMAYTPKALQTFEYNKDNLLTKIAVDKSNGDIYVGGQNILLHISKDLQLKQNLNIETIGSNPEFACEPITDQNCRNKYGSVDNVVNVLGLFSTTLLRCGSGIDGLCYTHDKNNIASMRHLQASGGPNKADSVLGSKTNNAVILVSENNETSCFNDLSCDHVMYTMSGIEPKPNGFHSQHAFSTLFLETDTEFPFFKHVGAAYKSYINLNQSLYAITPILSFQTQNHVYFVYRLNDKNKKDIRPTKIGRLDKTDEYYRTFNEVPIQCQNGSSLFYKHGLVGHFDQKFSTLYMTFSEGPNTTIGSVLCSYKLKDINSSFKRFDHGCRNDYKELGSLLWNVDRRPMPCSNVSFVLRYSSFYLYQ